MPFLILAVVVTAIELLPAENVMLVGLALVIKFVIVAPLAVALTVT